MTKERKEKKRNTSVLSRWSDSNRTLVKQYY